LVEAAPGYVLQAQITDAGAGLNIQSATVVILCEPQFKPTIESQAIARAHRMGQLHTVDDFRLLGVDTVDERMLEILG
ncbi:C-terminal helicase domain-containing protein, partial [Staphylococcus aureus]|uniref:C-terminal helicase domain-containing protein n=1 Tax=Staphylococcus aureus TaxID=1280 RepID=UPI0023B11978